MKTKLIKISINKAISKLWIVSIVLIMLVTSLLLLHERTYKISTNIDEKINLYNSNFMRPYNTSYWDGYSSQEPSRGDGTKENPYSIESANNLKWMANVINSSSNSFGESNAYAKAYYELCTNIDLNNYEWEPIAIDYDHRFMGTFIGNGYTISNLKVTGKTESGLFGDLTNANLCNFNIINAEIDGTDAGTLAGEAKVGIKLCNIQVLNSEIYGTTNSGGIIGKIEASSGTYHDLCNLSAINTRITTTDVKSVAGGIVGFITGSDRYSYNKEIVFF